MKVVVKIIHFISIKAVYHVCWEEQKLTLFLSFSRVCSLASVLISLPFLTVRST